MRDHTEAHWKLLEEHGWTKYFEVDLMDAEGPGRGLAHPQRQGPAGEPCLGKHILNYDSMLVLAHFKGHPMGGYGGALEAAGHRLRQPAGGKALIHSAGKTDDRFETWKQHASCVAFPEAMADAASQRGGALRGEDRLSST